jgi:hypothetical protein
VSSSSPETNRPCLSRAASTTVRVGDGDGRAGGSRYRRPYWRPQP